MREQQRQTQEQPYEPSEAERNAFGQMQARLIALLLRHHEGAFRRLFALREHTTPALDLIGHYRDLGVLFHLADALFEDILPRITRRLSFEAPHEHALEEPPTRGRVDWERTLDAALDDWPGEPPLLFRTRLRRRDFATPPNLLAVATLIEYRRAIEHLLWTERTTIGAEALRHPLNAIAERCRRELAFPQFAGLRARAEAILAGADGGVEALEERVRERLAPGGNAAYQDLLIWREQFRALQLLHRATAPADQTTLGVDPRRDNYLYQLWILFELADLLIQRGCLEELVIHNGRLRLVFHWGDGPERCRYELLHDQAVPEPAARWSADRSGLPVPGIRPDYYLRRSDPPPQRIEHAGTISWHEPGVIWDAKYYRERDRLGAPAAPIKRMLADLALLGLTHGALLFAFLRESAEPAAPTDPIATPPVDAWERAAPEGYRIAPLPGYDQPLNPDQQIAILRLLPGGDAAIAALRERLGALLDEAHARLRRPRVPRCHGIFLDTLSAAEATWLRDRYGAALDDDPADLLVCPKPHIGPWRIDLVSRTRHCCQDARVCQIIGDPERRKPVRPPRSAEELLRELQELFSGRASLDDTEVSAIAQQVEHLTRRFAELSGAYRRIDIYYNRLRDLGMHRTLDRLAQPERESLALALFLVEQLDSVGAADYSAPAIHVSSVLELEVKRRVYACPGLVSEIANPRNQTLGRLAFLRLKPWLFDGDWERILAHVARCWDGHVDADDPDFVADFDQFVNVLNTIARIRNRAAHTDMVPRHDYGELQRLALQGGPLRVGVLNALLLAWRDR
ncbi:hypothetical protein [Kallotenue papyrolyticum]|uniref:hypothetical protein n=1 Tax=Kallotenue papyrolyticum TaxID=1325125 RepID=UPI00049275B5|nr:hypothetical protein [Kallotenue papyrolyticum]